VLKLSAFTFMSHTQSATAPSSKFQLIINNALDTYRNRTKKDLLTHPLAAQLQACDTPAAIITILREQIHGLDQSQISAERWSKWLDPTVNVLFAFSAMVGAGAGPVRLRNCTHPISASSYSLWQISYPASVIFTGAGVLLSVRTLFNIRAWAHCNGLCFLGG
jgi:hypothetical protein